MVGALDAPGAAAVFHAIANQGENVTFHAAQAGVVDYAGFACLGNRDPSLILKSCALKETIFQKSLAGVYLEPDRAGTFQHFCGKIFPEAVNYLLSYTCRARDSHSVRHKESPQKEPLRPASPMGWKLLKLFQFIIHGQNTFSKKFFDRLCNYYC